MDGRSFLVRERSPLKGGIAVSTPVGELAASAEVIAWPQAASPEARATADAVRAAVRPRSSDR